MLKQLQFLVEGWPCLAVKSLPSFSLTLPPQKDRERIQGWKHYGSREKHRGCYLPSWAKQTNLGKINLLFSIRIDWGSDKTKTLKHLPTFPPDLFNSNSFLYSQLLYFPTSNNCRGVGKWGLELSPYHFSLLLISPLTFPLHQCGSFLWATVLQYKSPSVWSLHVIWEISTFSSECSSLACKDDLLPSFFTGLGASNFFPPLFSQSSGFF